MLIIITHQHKQKHKQSESYGCNNQESPGRRGLLKIPPSSREISPGFDFLNLLTDLKLHIDPQYLKNH